MGTADVQIMAKQKHCLGNELTSYTNGIVVKDEMIAK